jgi:undecaprenyl-diphosphatase
MHIIKVGAGFGWLDRMEGRLCLPCNRVCRNRLVKRYFQSVSRLGDGVLWYALLVALPALNGTNALLPVMHILLTSLTGAITYKLLKTSLLRERPFASHAAVEMQARPLDRYSFPSGHTLQAVLILVMLESYFPLVALMLIPFGLSVAASRVILGLHYPTDVLAGALIGWLIAASSLSLVAS